MKAATNGQQIGNVGVAEFFPKETPENRLDVILHEFCHFLYNSRSDADNLALQRAFMESNDFAAKPSYNLLNEGMATALGNGIIGRIYHPKKDWQAYVNRPLSFYNNPNIDRAGKRLLEMMDSWLPTGRPITDPAFVPQYLAAIKAAFGPDLTKPSLFLNEAYILVHEKFGMDFARQSRRDLGIAGAYLSVTDTVDGRILGDYAGQPNLSALFVVPPSMLESLVEEKVLLATEAEAIRAELVGKKGVLFAHPRSAHAHTFLVVTDDAGEAKRLVGQLAKAPRLFVGPFRS